MIALESEIESYLHYSQYQKELDSKTIKAYRIYLQGYGIVVRLVVEKEIKPVTINIQYRKI